MKPQVGAGFPAGGPLFVTNELICVISDRLWRTRYSADPSIIGKPLSLNDTPYTVVGVMPPKFHYPGRRRRLAAGALGLHAAQPRRALHGSGRASRAGHDVRAGAERGAMRSALRLAAGESAHQQGLGTRG